MSTGTKRRTPGPALRQGAPSPESALQECGPSRRRTVMRALRQLAGVTREYQSDIASKRPDSSAFSGPPGTGPPYTSNTRSTQEGRDQPPSDLTQVAPYQRGWGPARSARRRPSGCWEGAPRSEAEWGRGGARPSTTGPHRLLQRSMSAAGNLKGKPVSQQSHVSSGLRLGASLVVLLIETAGLPGAGCQR